MTEPQVPRICDVLTPAVDALAEGLTGAAKLARIRHANHGRFGDILRGFGVQAARARALMTREIIATRLIPENTGQPLRELAASECFATLESEPLPAIGEVRLLRKLTNDVPTFGADVFLPGVVARGSQFTRQEKRTGITYGVATYEAVEDVAFPARSYGVTPNGDGTFTHYQWGTVRIQATRAGVDANTPLEYDFSEVIDAGRLFDVSQPIDQRFKGDFFQAAGGLSEVTDPQLLAFAKAMTQGRIGANNAAALAGMLALARVRRVASVLDYPTATLRLFAADASWACSDFFRAAVLQHLHDNGWIGFGAKVDMRPVYNRPITVRSKVLLRSAVKDTERSELEKAIREKLTAYFDDRPDWYTWRIDAIGAVIAAADQRIQTCASGADAPVVLRNGVELEEPASKIDTDATWIFHYSLRAVELTFATVGGA